MQFPPSGTGSASTATPAQDPAQTRQASGDALANVPLARLIPASPAGVPVTIHAREQEKQGDIYTLRGEVEIDYEDYVIRADKITYNQATGDLQAEGHLQVNGGRDSESIAASHGTMNLNAETGRFYDVLGSFGIQRTGPLQRAGSRAVYTTPNPFLVSAKVLIQNGRENYELIGGSMTSCRLPKPDWRILAPHIQVAAGTAKAWNSNFRLFGIPILYLPYVTHNVNTSGRQSGFLIPAFGTSSIKGIIVGDSYYWAINRSSDLMLGLQYYSLRGFAESAEYRYRGRGNDFLHGVYKGLVDRGFGPQHVNQGGQDTLVIGRHDLTDETRAVVNAEYLSSYAYRQVFTENFALAVSSEVKSWAFVTHEANGIASSGDFERYQSFQNNTTGNEVRILHLPRMDFDTTDHTFGKSRLLWGSQASGGVLERSEPGFSSGGVGRVDLFPHLAMPWVSDGWTFRPQLGLRDTMYSRRQNLGPASPDASNTPTLSHANLNRKALEADMQVRPPVLERDFDGPFLTKEFGVALRHTIEPEANYRYVVGVNNFNSVPRFDADDIFSDTNELEYGLTQRLFLKRLRARPCAAGNVQAENTNAAGQIKNANCGQGPRELLSWFVGQKYFFDSTFGGAVIPGRRNIFATTLDFSGVSYITSPRHTSPVISKLRVNTSATTDLEWDLDYDAKTTASRPAIFSQITGMGNSFPALATPI